MRGIDHKTPSQDHDLPLRGYQKRSTRLAIESDPWALPRDILESLPLDDRPHQNHFTSSRP